jgi:hypothetical protein
VQDTDGDGYDDFEEILTYATEPNNAWDKPLTTSSTKPRCHTRAGCTNVTFSEINHYMAF